MLIDNLFSSLCDRTILKFIHLFQGDGERDIVYDTMGPNVCMGDHKVTVRSNMHIVQVNKPAVKSNSSVLSVVFL